MNKYYYQGFKYNKRQFVVITQSLLHFTYTKYNKQFGKRKLWSDISWGCCIRCFQMMLGIYLKNIKIKKKDILNLIYKENGILSLQNFVNQLNKNGYLGGEYLGTFMVSNIYSKLINKELYDVHMTENNIISVKNINIKKPSLLLFSTRLGLDKLESKYIESIKSCFSCPNFIGLIGGVDKSSYFYYSIDNYNNLYYLDPHIIKFYKSYFKEEDFISKNHSFVKINKISPSNLFCFYYENEKEYIFLKAFLDKHPLFKLGKLETDFKSELIDDDWVLY